MALPVRPLSRLDFKSRPLGRRRNVDLPPAARIMLELMVTDGLSLEEVAERRGIKLSTAKYYFHLPGARAHYIKFVGRFRDGELPKNLRTAKEIRDDRRMAESAAGNRVRLEASRYLDGESASPGVTVNVGLGIGVSLQPGYQVSIPHDVAAQARHALAASGSSASIFDGDSDVETIETIEADPVAPEPEPSAPPSPPTTGYRDAWDPSPRRPDGIAPLDSRLRRVP